MKRLSPPWENSEAPVSKKDDVLLRVESERVREGTGDGFHFSTLVWKLVGGREAVEVSEWRPRSDWGGAVLIMI